MIDLLRHLSRVSQSLLFAHLPSPAFRMLPVGQPLTPRMTFVDLGRRLCNRETAFCETKYGSVGRNARYTARKVYFKSI